MTVSFLFWMLLSWQFCEGTLLANLAIAESQQTDAQIISMVTNPFQPGEALVTQSNHYISSLHLTALSVTPLSAGRGFTNGELTSSKFNGPMDIVETGENQFAIADFYSECVRELVYSEQTRTVSNLSGERNRCTFKNQLADKARPSVLALDKSARILYIVYENRIIGKLDLSSKEISYVDESERKVGLATSPYYHHLYFAEKIENQIKVMKFDGETGGISELVSVKAVWETTSSVDGLISAPQTLIVFDWDNLNTPRHNHAFKLIGSHFIMFLGKTVYNLDMDTNMITHVGELSTDTGVGILAHFDDPVAPNYLYVWQNGKINKYHVDACMTRRHQRPPVFSYSWLRTGGYGCKNIDQHEIHQPFSYTSGPAVAEAQASSCVAPQSCFSVCKRKCEEMDSCVAFQCNSRDEMCTLSTCALVSDVPTSYLSCYRLTDVVYAQPAL